MRVWLKWRANCNTTPSGKGISWPHRLRLGDWLCSPRATCDRRKFVRKFTLAGNFHWLMGLLASYWSVRSGRDQTPDLVLYHSRSTSHGTHQHYLQVRLSASRVRLRRCGAKQGGLQPQLNVYSESDWFNVSRVTGCRYFFFVFTQPP